MLNASGRVIYADASPVCRVLFTFITYINIPGPLIVFNQFCSFSRIFSCFWGDMANSIGSQSSQRSGRSGRGSLLGSQGAVGTPLSLCGQPDCGNKSSGSRLTSKSLVFCGICAEKFHHQCLGFRTAPSGSGLIFCDSCCDFF